MSSPQVEEIKSRLSISDVVGSYIKLEKAGQNFKARCPFHNEKTPSFTVSPSRDMYHCFGCDRGGDIISFVEEIEGLDFQGALKILADRAGVKLTTYNKEQDTEREQLLRVLEESTKFFENKLLKYKDLHKEVLEYLKGRGLTDETIRNFRIGFAPSGWQNLYNTLKEKGFSDDLMRKAGLVTEGERGLYDRFRERIIFPIFDYSGNPIAFSGRIFETDTLNSTSPAQAKYINSPATALYDKSKALYGYDKAKVEMRKKDFCVLVEGQFDLIMSHQVGVYNTVAVSGTALTNEHLKNIGRFTNNLIIAFDSDIAGMSASGRGVDIALSLGMEVKAVTLPQGLDPADFIKENPDKWAETIKEAKHVIDFYIETFIAMGYEQRDLSKKIKEEVLPYVGKIDNKIDQAHFVGKIARLLGVSEEPVWEEVKKVALSSQVETQKKESLVGVRGGASVTRKIVIEGKVLGIIFWQEGVEKPLIDTKALIAKYEEIVGSERAKKVREIPDSRKNKMIIEAEERYKEDGSVDHDIEELLVNLETESLKEELLKYFDELRKAERGKSQKDIDEYSKKCHEIQIKIDNLSNSFN